ncbi:putative deoxyribonuclease TATDN2 [Octopus bimaculoides]|uniref:Uncharacterized protein n=1 Tax=Octopus bimaculoides TaxID=37653 RepID=A0A0L8HMJ2_OCTBM|nr:putative deoxyribonuclease TATDN2 [Octopus bimaculoides]|eukprot:XP_014771063.1 PREDICTED: putative deoxyribonuclease TATDN2 [Octopus bimaculoides]
MFKKHKKPDRALYVFPARRMIAENESQQKPSLINDELEYNSNSSVDVTHRNTVNTDITHQCKHLESPSSRQQRTVSIATRDQVNGLHKILSNKLNNESSPYRQQRNVPRASRSPSNKFNNKTSPNRQQLIVTYTSKDQINNGIHKTLSNTLNNNNKSFPDEGEFGVTKEVGHDFVCSRQFGRARQPYSSNSQEANKFMGAGRGRLLSLMENYLKMESEERNGHSKESDSLTSADTCGTVIHNQHTIHNNSHPNSSSNGVLRNKRENPRILGKGRARLAKKSTMAEKKSPRVSLDRSSLNSPDMSAGQFDSCDQEEEVQQQEEKSPRVSMDRGSLKSPDISWDSSEIPDGDNTTEKTAVENKPLSWAEEMREFDRLHLKGNNSDYDDDDDDSNCSMSPHVLRNSVEKENWLYNSGSPENHVSYKTNNYSPNGNQYSENGVNNRHRSKHRINTRWRTVSNDSGSNGNSFNSRNKVTSNFVVNGNQVSPKDLQHKINSITNNGRINTSSYGNKRTSLTNGDHTERITKSWEESFLSRCSAAGYKFFDTHCHLDRIFDDLKSKSEKHFSNFKEFKEANWTTFPKEFAGCLTVFCDPWRFDSKGSLLCSFIMEDNVWIAMGCHPKRVKYFTAERMQQLKDCLLQVPSIVAVGEIGLDYSGVFYQQIDDQKRALRDQIRLAVDMNKPIIIHCRDAEEDCLQIFLEECPQNWPIHLHCYTNSYNCAQKWLNAFPNLCIGLTPKVTYKSSTALHDTAHRISLDRLLLETDAPYFIPSMVSQNSMVTSHPGMAFSVAETVADLKNISVKEVLKACLENTQRLYGIKL